MGRSENLRARVDRTRNERDTGTPVREGRAGEQQRERHVGHSQVVERASYTGMTSTYPADVLRDVERAR